MRKLTLCLFVLVMSFVTAPGANAETLVCSPRLRDVPTTNNAGVGIYDAMLAFCEGKSSGHSYRIDVEGYGPALRYALAEGFTLICPWRSGTSVEGTYYGVKADAQIFVGARFGLFYNKENACIMTGVQGGAIGVSVVGGTLTISASNPDLYQYGR